MSDSTLILRMNLLSEFVESDLQKGQDHLKEKIRSLFNELEGYELTAEETHTLLELKKSYEKRLKMRQKSPLEEVRRNALRRAFLKYRGLVFDLKTRMDYTSAQVAIQDGLDLSEYVKEIIEEITTDLNDSLVPENEVLAQVRDEISGYYFSFQRDRLQELFPQFSQTLRIFQEALDDLNCSIS